MYEINFSNRGHPRLEKYQKCDKIGKIASFLSFNWKMLNYQGEPVFAGPMTVYSHHPEKPCVSIYTEDNPPYISFLSIDKKALKETLEELALGFDEENIREF